MAWGVLLYNWPWKPAKILGHPGEIRATKISLGRQMNTDDTDIGKPFASQNIEFF